MTIRATMASTTRLAVVALAATACGTDPTAQRTTTSGGPIGHAVETTTVPTSIPNTAAGPGLVDVATTVDPATPTTPVPTVVLVRSSPTGTVSVHGAPGTAVRITRCDHSTIAVGDPVLEVMAHCTLSVGSAHSLDVDGTANIAVPPPGTDLTGRPLADDADVVAIDADTAIPVGVVG